MKKLQWYLLGWSFLTLAFFFTYLNLNHGFLLLDDPCLDIDSSELDNLAVLCIVRGEIYAPFTYIFFGLGIIFFLLGLSSRQKKS